MAAIDSHSSILSFNHRSQAAELSINVQSKGDAFLITIIIRGHQLNSNIQRNELPPELLVNATNYSAGSIVDREILYLLV